MASSIARRARLVVPAAGDGRRRARAAALPARLRVHRGVLRLPVRQRHRRARLPAGADAARPHAARACARSSPTRDATVVLTTDAHAVARRASSVSTRPSSRRCAGSRPTASSDADAGCEPHRPRRATVAFLQYTSGSTGSCRRASMVTHGNLLHNSVAIHAGARLDSPTRSRVSWLPPYHDMGLIGASAVAVRRLSAGVDVAGAVPAAAAALAAGDLDAPGATRAARPTSRSTCACAEGHARAARRARSRAAGTRLYVSAEPVRRTRSSASPRLSRVRVSGRPRVLPLLRPRRGHAGRRGRDQGHRLSSTTSTARRRSPDWWSASAAHHRWRACRSSMSATRSRRARRAASARLGARRQRRPRLLEPPRETARSSARARDGRRTVPAHRRSRLLRDGELFVTGRVKEVIIVRGRKHFPTRFRRHRRAHATGTRATTAPAAAPRSP